MLACAVNMTATSHRIDVIYVLYTLLGMQTWQFLWIRNVLHKDAGTAITVVTAA